MVPDAAVEVVCGTEIRITLDAPWMLTSPGPVVVQVRNPDGGVSAMLQTISLIGPAVTSVKVTSNANLVTLRIRGIHFLPGATVLVSGMDGAGVPTQSVERTRPKRFRVTIQRADAPAGAMLEVRVVNPGPVASDPHRGHAFRDADETSNPFHLRRRLGNADLRLHPSSSGRRAGDRSWGTSWTVGPGRPLGSDCARPGKSHR